MTKTFYDHVVYLQVFVKSARKRLLFQFEQADIYPTCVDKHVLILQ